MTSALADLEPKPLWNHFDALAAIPRASTKEAAARDYVRAQAARLKLEMVQDKFGNLVIRKPAHAGREGAPMTLLQGHLDMVCEKHEQTRHDFSADPIRVLRDGDWLKADGTTLGADNGVGVSAALAVLESTDIAHGPLEFVFTVEEETGLIGASEFPGGLLRSRYFLNLDNEEIGTLCIGCSGGMNTTARRKATPRTAKGGAAWRVKVSGLKGGHSGVDIHRGRGNALRLLGRLLQDLRERLDVEIAGLQGGSARNAIPRDASAVVLADASKEAELKKLLTGFEADARSELGEFDPGVQVSAEKVERPAQVLDGADADAAIALLVGLPHGVLEMSPDIEGLTQTSTNLATVGVKDGAIEIGTNQRSAIASAKRRAARMAATLCRLAGFETDHSADYPGWKPEPESEIVRQVQAVHQELFGAPAKLIAMHAGLECGVIGEKYPEMQMVSFGPTIIDVHSPHERVQISTVESFWKYLCKVLERL